MHPEIVRPQLRPLEIFPHGKQEDLQFVLRDPQGYAPSVVLPYGGALLATLMNGQRTLAELQTAFQAQAGVPVALLDLERLIQQLDEVYLLDSARFQEFYQREIHGYLTAKARPAAHAGGAYEDDPDELRQQLAELFTGETGPGAPERTRPRKTGLRGVLSPHIDLHRGGAAFAWAYKRLVEETDADIFVIFGTAHSGLSGLFSVSRKDFETPLGSVETDREFIDRLEAELQRESGSRDSGLFADELAHRHEHSIEFQVLFLQYLLGDRRKFRVVPVLVGSFHEFIELQQQPTESPAVAAFVNAMRATEQQYAGRVFYVSGGDLAHVGKRFGDDWNMDHGRLEQQSANDRSLLTRACEHDPAGFFQHVAAEQDASRICGLSPTYTMMQVMRATRGELLMYDQAVEPNGNACVSFASVAFYRDQADAVREAV